MHRIGFLMDAYERLNLDTETSLLLMDELTCRGHVVYWLEQDDVALVGGRLEARAKRVVTTAPLRLDGADRVDINCLDALIIRKDPPFDARYLHLTYLLEFLDREVLQINSPAALRNLNEKIATLRWPEFCPSTVVSSDVGRLLAFASGFEQIVLKPLDECSGRGITFLRGDDPDAAGKLAALTSRHGFLMAQEYLSNIARGDKRVYLVAGEPIGWVNRLPAGPGRLANIHQGAVCEATSLTLREEEVSLMVGRELVEEGILLAGLDFIDELLTEVNVTSPSAVRQINAASGGHLERRIVDAILSRVGSRQSTVFADVADVADQAVESQ